jgi:hypothetical protein
LVGSAGVCIAAVNWHFRQGTARSSVSGHERAGGRISEKAAECQRQAVASTDEKILRAYEDLAAQWTEMAEQAEGLLIGIVPLVARRAEAHPLQ